MKDRIENDNCSICGGDRNADQTEVKRIMKKHNFSGEFINPGGRQLLFGKDRSLQIGDQCNSCDSIKILGFLGVV